MAISKEHKTVIELADRKRKPARYEIDTEPEFPHPGQPGYMGTYTPPAPYHIKKRNDTDAKDG